LTPKLVQLAPGAVRRSPYQARRKFDPREIERLAGSLRMHGMLQPIVVRQVPEGYELIAGERRLRAALAAGMAEIPALVREESNAGSAVAGIIENVQRCDLGVIEEAEAYRQLMHEFGWNQSEVAKRVGKSPSAVANKLRLLQLGEEIRELAATGALGERHLRALLRVSGVRRVEIARRAASEGWTVREVEAEIQAVSRETPKRWVSDVRIVVNALHESVARLQAAGVAVELVEEESAEALELRLRIRRR